MEQILHLCYDLLARADAILKDDKNYSLIDETHPFYEGKEKMMYNYALSSVDLEAIKQIAEKEIK